MQCHSFFCRIALLLAASAAFAQAPGKFDDPPAALTLDAALAAVARYQPGESRQPVNALDREVMQATATPAARAAMSARLTSLLVDPASTPMCRKLVCHQWLPVVAGDEALPVLKAMLATAGQEQTALDALARLPGEAAAAVLREALAHPEPKVRDMAAEICGFRGDAAAVPALIALAGQSPASVRALARIGTPEAVKFLPEGTEKSDPSDRVFALATTGVAKPLLAADQPRHHRIAGLAAASRSADGIATLSAALHEADEAMAATALALLEASVDPKATAMLMDALQASPPERRPYLLEALANRGDPAALPAITPLVSGTNVPVRLAALRAVGLLGGADTVAVLLPVALSDDPEAAAAARESLVRLRGDAASAALRLGASVGDAASRAFHLALLASRADPAVRDLLFQAAADASPQVRRVGWSALADQPDAADYPRILGLLTAATEPADIAGAEKAAFKAGSLFESAATRVQPVAAAIKTAPPAAAASLARLLGLFGGPEALVPLRDAAARDATRDAAVRALCAWNGPEVIDDLQAFATTSANATHKALALRGLQRLAANDKFPLDARLRILREMPKVTNDPALLDAAEQTRRKLDPSARLESAMPTGFALAAYIDCGTTETQAGRKGGAMLTQSQGQAYAFPAPESTPDSVATVAFGTTLSFKLEGLVPGRRYYFGFSWWDGDGGGRRQSVRMGGGAKPQWVTVLPATEPLAYLAGKPTWAQLLLPIEVNAADGGMLNVELVKEAGPNAVVSEAWLLEETTPAEPPRKRVVIVTGDEYPAHLWRQTAPELAKILSEDPRLEVSVVECGMLLASPLLDQFDGVLLNFKEQGGPDLPVAAWQNLQRFTEQGRGLVLFHFACGAAQHWQDYEALVARVWDPKLRGHDPYGPFTVRTVDTHPVTKGLGVIQTTDELYTCLRGDRAVEVIASATSKVDQKEYPMGLIHLPGKGRVFNCTLGHDLKAMESRGVREMYRRGVAWSVALEP